MLSLFSLVAVLAITASAEARGAGRAFPMLAENYAIDNLARINPGIEWDPTNFLVDKSGEYANCNQIRRGYEDLYELTPEGQSIGVVYDHTSGHGVDAESVSMYIRNIIDSWMRSHEYDTTVRGADRFGCSVRPGCDGITTVACLFSPGQYQGEQPEVPSGEPPAHFSTLYPPRPSTRPPTHRPPPTHFPSPVPPNQKGQAFTPEQYELAESITGNSWDRKHFLENLSGFEITCSMMDHGDWLFKEAKEIAKGYGLDVSGLEGEALNRGSTQQAMEIILRGFKVIRESSRVGCSVIPDCRGGRGDLGDEMWVVVSCIYENPY